MKKTTTHLLLPLHPHAMSSQDPPFLSFFGFSNHPSSTSTSCTAKQDLLHTKPRKWYLYVYMTTLFFKRVFSNPMIQALLLGQMIPRQLNISLSSFSEVPAMASFFFVLFSLFVLVSIPLLVFLYFIVRPRPVKIPLKNRHVFITGGSSGIGLALAHQAVAEGARVSILARSIDKLEEAKTSIRLSTGIDVSVFSADVRDYDALKRAVDEAGPIDVLIANHGVFWATELEKQELFGIKFMVDVNLMGSFNLVKAALPAMKNRPKDRGPASIALMSSQAGQVGIYGYTAYSASKFGLRGLAEALQHEVVADDIYVSLIFPPDTDTPGLLEENKKKPQITSLIVASSGLMKANDVAKKALNGIKSGSFIIPCNFEGYMLALATAGLSPQGSFLMAFIEVVTAGILRIAGLCFQWTWYRGIEKWHAQIHGSDNSSRG